MVIQLEKVSYEYGAGGPWALAALRDIDLKVEGGRFVGIAGTTGSGKSTLLQLFNGIISPASGRVAVLDTVITGGEKPPKLRGLRRRVGLVFQFPEQQMFEETVEKDIIFGPMNFGVSEDDAKRLAREAMDKMGLDHALLQRSPFELSGGQMRKAAIASVLAMEPDILVLDEPAATLDPESRSELIRLLRRLCTEEGRTVIMVTHRMDELLPAADAWVIMHEGRCVFSGSAKELAGRPQVLEHSGMTVPLPLRCWSILAERFGLQEEEPCFAAEELAARIAALRNSSGQSDARQSAGRTGESICATSC